MQAADTTSLTSHGDGSPAEGPGSHLRSACEPCRKRKIKCSGGRPVCDRCSKLQKACEWKPVQNPSNYVLVLEERVQQLESTLAAINDDPARSGSHEPTGTKKRSRTTVLNPVAPQEGNSPQSPVTSVSSPYTLAGTSTRPLPSNAQLVHQMPVELNLSWLTVASCQATPPEKSARFDNSVLPSAAVVEQLVDHFCQYTNSAFAIFHVPTLRSQVNAVCDTSRTSSPNDICTVLLVLAVSATSLPKSSLLHKSFWSKAEVFWQRAQEYLPAALEADGNMRLQILLIHLQYVLYNPGAGRVWDLAGAAVRAAVELGLHLDCPYETNGLEQDMRRRLFWAAYCVDRNLAVALGRPPNIADDWISTTLPSQSEDDLITTHPIPACIAPSPSKVSLLHHIQIRRIQSEIHHRLFRLSSTTPPEDWYQDVLMRLQNWTKTMPSSVGFCSIGWLNINLHVTMVLLHRPAPANPSPKREQLKQALHSAGQVIKCLKDVHRQGRINYNWISMYHLFIAGLTYLNSLWQAHRSGWSIVPSYFDAVLEVQTCSGLMEALAAVTPGTEAIRDAFESVSEGIIRHLTSRATTASRPTSPFPPSIQPSIDRFTTSNTPEVPASNNSTHANDPNDPFGTLLGTDTLEQFFDPHLLDNFFLRPIGEYRSEEWERAVGMTLESLEGGNNSGQSKQA